MYDDVYDDTLNETDMLAICQGMDSTVLETTALGQEIATLSSSSIARPTCAPRWRTRSTSSAWCTRA